MNEDAHEEYGNPARGIINAVILSIPLWIGIIYAASRIWNALR